MAAVAGDYDNDGMPDLLVLKPGGLALFHNEGEGRFKDVSAAAQLPAWPYLAATAAFVDIDHDGDLDVFVAGLATRRQRQGARRRPCSSRTTATAPSPT